MSDLSVCGRGYRHRIPGPGRLRRTGENGIVTTVEETRPPGVLRSLWADRRFGPLPALLLTLTAVTGVVDAVSILSLGRVFVANMTGNVVFAAFAITGAPGFSLSASLFALAGFLAGAAGGGALINRVGADRAVLLRAGVLCELVLIAGALALAAASSGAAASHGTMDITSPAFGAGVTDGVALLLAIALGIQNAVARKLAVPDLTTTVLTMTITGLGADLRALTTRGGGGAARGGGSGANAGRRAAWAALRRRLLAIAAMVTGAMVAAWLVLDVSAVAALSLATTLMALTAAAAAYAATRDGAWRATASPPPAKR
jgi:uncharacterized membrane protein YoaK (UPF0700 family)